MSFEEAMILLATLVALLASAFFSAAEIAIFSIRAPALKALRERHDARAERINELLTHPRRFLTTILLGNVVANAVVVFGLVLLWHKIKLSDPAAWTWWMPMVVASILLLTVGELFPKAIARQRSTRVALCAVNWIYPFDPFLLPMSPRMERLSETWAAHLVPATMRPMRGLTEGEYVTMLDVGTREGALLPTERRLIERTLALAERNLRELMTPRSEMCCVNVDLELEAMKTQAAAMRHRRLPIFDESLDSIVSVLNVKRLLIAPHADLIACIEPPAFVPETMNALELLKNFLRGSQRLALVVDEFGGVEGLITLEDIVEEIFGEIFDEYDDDTPDWEEIEPRVFVVRGSARLIAISKWLGAELESDGVDTLAGWLTDQLGALPRVGDRIAWSGYSFQVEKTSRLRVSTVLVRDERRKLP